MNVPSYGTPLAFKKALEDRLRNDAPARLVRNRQLLVFERFLARIVQELDCVVLKGGFALELRTKTARTTKDIDLRLSGSPDEALVKLQRAGRLDLGDFMAFEVASDNDHPDIQNEGMPYVGKRFRVECRLAGKQYGEPFGVDVAFGDPMVNHVEIVTAPDTLGFARIAPPKLPLYPIETHIAENLHAYTIPRVNPNSRVKDLPDIALLATVRSIEARTLMAAFDATFKFRNTHQIPTDLPLPPIKWREAYAKLAKDNGLPWADLDSVTAKAQAFLNPALARQAGTTWDPKVWHW